MKAISFDFWGTLCLSNPQFRENQFKLLGQFDDTITIDYWLTQKTYYKKLADEEAQTSVPASGECQKVARTAVLKTAIESAALSGGNEAAVQLRQHIKFCEQAQIEAMVAAQADRMAFEIMSVLVTCSMVVAFGAASLPRT